MRILQVNTLARTQSTGRTTYEMHMELKKRNIDSYVAVSYAGINEEKYGQVLVGSKTDMKIHAVLSRLTGLQGYYSYGPTRKMLRYIEEVAPDIVIIRVLHSNFLNINKLLRYLKNNEIATIIVLHDLWIITGHCFYPCMTSCKKYEQECGRCNQKRMANKSLWFDMSKKVWRDRRDILKNWNKVAVVGVSKWAVDCAKKASIVENKDNIFQIYNWIDADKFHYMNVDRDADVFIILGVSSGWTEEKGLDDFIKLSYMLHEDEKLIMVGRMESADRTKFKNGSVEFVDFTHSEQELANLYNKSDVFVSMSRQETFGKTIAEAVCCGTPAITYNQTAAPEIVSDNCGYAVDAGDVEAVYKKIKKVKEKGKVYYTPFCLKKAESEFNKERNIDKYVALFHKICGSV